MQVAFVSNYINHHQIPFSNAMYARLGENYFFIQTEPMEEERIQMGWSAEGEQLPYVKYYYKDPVNCQNLIDNCDIVIYGGTDDESYISRRLLSKRVIFRYSERLYKTGQWKAISPRGLMKKYKDHTTHRKDSVYLLCSGAYVPDDFHMVHAYPDKMFRWGYFPETKYYDIEELLKNKTSTEILWAGRMIDWKHPELPIQMAKQLREKKLAFHLTMIGGGAMEEELKKLIQQEKLEDHVTMAGYKTPAEVREHMERAGIYLITSDYQEGWGAVLNEAMNSGCAVVSSHAIGAAPYLIRHEVNGMLFQSGNVESLTACVESLLLQSGQREKLGENAYHTITEEWNAECAADRLLQLMRHAIDTQTSCNNVIYSDWSQGPCSKALIVREPKMYRYCTERK